MSTLPVPSNVESNPQVKAVFDDIRQTRQSDFVNNMWRYLAFDPDLLESTWREVKAVMATPSALDPHTASAVSKGMSSAQHADLLRVIALAGKTNQLASAMQLPVDAVFNKG